MKIFINFLKNNKTFIVYYLVTISFFIISFILFHLPLKAVLYPFLISLLFGFVLLLVSFHKYRKKHFELIRQLSLSYDTLTILDRSDNLLENGYKQIIEKLQRDIVEIKNEDLSIYNDMIDYYTIWVHQIKTPISSMNLKLQNRDDEIFRELSLDLFHIQQYVEMVLAFLRLDSSSNDFVFREIKIDEILKPILRKYAKEFIYRKLILDYKPIDKTIISDEKWFGFIIEQILSNALKYTKNGHIRIYLFNDDRLCIEDEGIGIDEADLPRIFEKGFTGRNGRQDKSASGLGLYLCEKICKKLSLKLLIESKVNEGTKAYLCFNQEKNLH